MPKDDCQSFFKVLTQISPAEETFGWKILVANQPMVENQPRVACVGGRGRKPTFRWCSRELAREAELDLEVTASVWCTLCKSSRREDVVWSGASCVYPHNKSLPTRSFDNPSHIEHIVLIRDDANSLGWICPELIELLHESTKHSWRNGLFSTQ